MQSGIEPALATKQNKAKPSCGRVLQDYDCNYDTYLDANPSVKAWAVANPDLAAKERTRLGAFTQEEIEKQSNPKTNSLQRMQPELGAMEESVLTPTTGIDTGL